MARNGCLFVVSAAMILLSPVVEAEDVVAVVVVEVGAADAVFPGLKAWSKIQIT
jgi:hypothetical protein